MKARLNVAICLVSVMIFLPGCDPAGDGGGGSVRVQKVKSAADLKSMMDGRDLMVVHALDAEHYAKGHVPGAVNIDYEKMTPEMLPEDKSKEMVFYCVSPFCPVGRMAAKKAAGWGYGNVWVFEGGINAWRDAEYPVEKK